MKIFFQLLVLLALIQTNCVFANQKDTAEITSSKPLIVAIQYDQTFVQKDGDEKLSGPLIDFWALIAEELKMPYVFKEMPLNEIITALQKGTIDVALAPFNITADREKLFDFSTPLGETRPAVLTLYKVKHEHPWIEAIELFLSWRTLKIIFILLAVVLFLGIVIWLIEKKSILTISAKPPSKALLPVFSGQAQSSCPVYAWASM